MDLFLGLAGLCERKVLLIADAYYASGKVIRPLLRQGHHLLTRARMNTVAYMLPEPNERRQRGRPRIYGPKVRLRDLIAERGLFQAAPSPIPGESHTTLQYCWFDLLWRPVGHEVRFVVVKHPLRGVIILMTTDTDLDPLDAVVLYSHRFKIETGFRHAIHVLGSYAYHFWMEQMDSIRRRSGDQHLHMKSEEYRRGVRRKMQAYHAHVQIGCIAQGLLIHLAVNHGEQVWKQFRSWLRTMDPTRPPSELVVAYSLREALPEFLEEGARDDALRKILGTYSTIDESAAVRRAG